MSGRLEKYSALITGGARGMGAAAELFVAEGANVVFTDIAAEGEKLAARLGDRAHFMKHDVSSRSDCERVVSSAEELIGPINVLIKNASTAGGHKPIDEVTEDDYRNTINVNHLGVVFGIEAILGSMRHARGGSIINVSSAWGLVGGPCEIEYCASKFAVAGISKAAAAEHEDQGIRVDSIHPGLVRTPGPFCFSYPMRRASVPVPPLLSTEA